MVDPDPMIRPEPLIDDAPERALRPERLDDFTGQAEARSNLQVFIEAARRRGEAMDHLLFHGPPGLGKTTLAQIVSRELGVNFRMTSGPVIAKPGDLAAVLTNLEARDVLFIDEIHRLSPVVEEILYPAMEDFELDLVIGEGPAARTVRIDLAPFTLIGATTRLGLLTTPLRDRFGIPVRLEFYTYQELSPIVGRAARLMGLQADDDGIGEIAGGLGTYFKLEVAAVADAFMLRNPAVVGRPVENLDPEVHGDHVRIVGTAKTYVAAHF